MSVNPLLTMYLFILVSLIANAYCWDFTPFEKDLIYVPVELTFDEAVTLCESNGGTLLQIESMQQQRFVEFKYTHKVQNTWIGAKSGHGSNQFHWLRHDMTIGGDCFINWGSGQPNELDKDETGLYMGLYGYWFDAPTTDKYFAICERSRRSTQYDLLVDLSIYSYVVASLILLTNLLILTGLILIARNFIVRV